ncbi:PLP-dependent enzyme, histidinol-phosphate/aromatic aminotransferase or cobyric acid decarboxylase [Mycolicibacterium conceptionense]|uniref:PLP-dependent enzyme, histidinol-phosphate/aromatic aminotransferase or cobyric acid decarboxylase n=1 Tax=Mycolicibacterium conceptionense TaxID=451644 RepID=A0A0U1DSG8_9MYCO|nr:PLP-dependent enzyme, histidinol-phosphate/aromatic aminotransferase or cobyric acid decarboxylase [Mycolicibacterium conceptionense]
MAGFGVGAARLEKLTYSDTRGAGVLHTGLLLGGLAELRAAMTAGLAGLGLSVVAGDAPFVLFTVPDAELMRKHLESKGIAVRRCDTFVGLPDNYLRAAVRPEWPALIDAMTEVLL